MMVHYVSLLLLAVMFVTASVWPVNLGVLALVASFVVGCGFAGLDADGVLQGFPGDLLVLLVGVTYLFGIAEDNGSLHRIVEFGMRAVGHRLAVLPWLVFGLTAFIAAAGALSAAAVAIVAPIALRLGAQHRLSPLLMGLMVVQGATAGSFSPLSPFGAITNDLLGSHRLEPQPLGLFANAFAFNLVVAIVVFCAFGGIRLLRGRHDESAVEPEYAAASARDGAVTVLSRRGGGPGAARGAELGDRERVSRNTHQVLTIIGIVGLIGGAAFLGLDVGFTALTVGLVLTLLSPNRYSETVKRLPWAAVLLVCGVLTYVGVLDEIGTIDKLSELLTAGGAPLVTALAAAYIGGIISAFASTAGVLGASIPLALPLLEQGTLPLLGTVSAVAVASSIVDVSPMSTNGALLVANQETMEPRVFFRRLLLWAVPLIAVAPLLSWFVFVVL